jgi:hypothetical protein
MIAKCYAPFRTNFFILPFENFFYIEISGVRGVIIMDYAKAPAADIAYRITAFKMFPFDNAINDTIQMYGPPAVGFGNGFGDEFYRFFAPGA